MYEEALGLGVGYLVYKGIMSELAKEPDNGAVTVKGGDMFGFGKLTPEEIRKAYISQGEGTFSDIWKGIAGQGQAMKRGEYAELYDTLARKERITGGQWEWGIPTPLSDITFGIGGSLLPEGFELVGPSRTGITRPKGLD